MKSLFLLLILCINGSSIFSFADLKKAVDELDTAKVIKILDEEKKELSDNEILVLITDLSAQIQQENRVRIGLSGLASITGGGISYLIARRMDSTTTGLFIKTLLGVMGAQFGVALALNSYPYHKAFTILHILLKRMKREDIVQLRKLGLIAAQVE